jgi:hypothetical protein
MYINTVLETGTHTKNTVPSGTVFKKLSIIKNKDLGSVCGLKGDYRA